MATRQVPEGECPMSSPNMCFSDTVSPPTNGPLQNSISAYFWLKHTVHTAERLICFQANEYLKWESPWIKQKNNNATYLAPSGETRFSSSFTGKIDKLSDSATCTQRRSYLSHSQDMAEASSQNQVLRNQPDSSPTPEPYRTGGPRHAQKEFFLIRYHVRRRGRGAQTAPPKVRNR